MNKQSIYRMLFEAESDDAEKGESPVNPLNVQEPSVKSRPADDSVDDQIDALILRYENASIREESDSLAESLTGLNLKMLLEQEEEADEEVEEDPGGDEVAEPGGSEDMSVTEPAKEQEVPPLDVDAFTGRIVRLYLNHKNLLNIEAAIINRAKNFLDENYGDLFVNKYLNRLESEHGIRLSEFETIKYSDDDNFAIGANPAGAGITGGG